MTVYLLTPFHRMFNNLDRFPAEYDHIFNFGLIGHWNSNSLLSFDEHICIIRIIFNQIEIKSIIIIGVKIHRFTFQEDIFHEIIGIRSNQGLNGQEMTSIECSR